MSNWTKSFTLCQLKSRTLWFFAYRRHFFPNHQSSYHHGCQCCCYLETILTGRKNVNDLWSFQRVSQKNKNMDSHCQCQCQFTAKYSLSEPYMTVKYKILTLRFFVLKKIQLYITNPKGSEMEIQGKIRIEKKCVSPSVFLPLYKSKFFLPPFI